MFHNEKTQIILIFIFPTQPCFRPSIAADQALFFKETFKTIKNHLKSVLSLKSQWETKSQNTEN